MHETLITPLYPKYSQIFPNRFRLHPIMPPLLFVKSCKIPIFDGQTCMILIRPPQAASSSSGPSPHLLQPDSWMYDLWPFGALGVSFFPIEKGSRSAVSPVGSLENVVNHVNHPQIQATQIQAPEQISFQGRKLGELDFRPRHQNPNSAVQPKDSGDHHRTCGIYQPSAMAQVDFTGHRADWCKFQ